jgi:hypothetical protein
MNARKPQKSAPFELTTPEFENWMNEEIALLVEHVPGLDGSPTSLDRLESWLLSRYASVADARPESEAITIGRAARYLGEVFRKHTGSKWAIENRDPKYMFRGFPVLVGGTLGSMPDCPRSIVTASLDRRTGHYFSSILSNVLPKSH